MRVFVLCLAPLPFGARRGGDGGGAGGCPEIPTATFVLARLLCLGGWRGFGGEGVHHAFDAFCARSSTFIRQEWGRIQLVLWANLKVVKLAGTSNLQRFRLRVEGSQFCAQ